VFGARAAAATLDQPDTGEPPDPPPSRFAPPTSDTREAVWRCAGPRRDAASLEPLLDDPYPLARLIARVALERRESRGTHRRTDFPLPDHALDGIHLVIAPDGSAQPERWA
jgi:aspartate oxidase